MALEQNIVPPKQELVSFEIDQKTDKPPTFEEIIYRSLGRLLEFSNVYIGQAANWLGVYLIIERPTEPNQDPKVRVQHLWRVQDRVFELHEIPKLTNTQNGDILYEYSEERVEEFYSHTRKEAANIPVQHAASDKELPKEIWASVDILANDMRISFRYELTAPYTIDDPIQPLLEWKEKVQNKDESIIEMFTVLGTPELQDE